MRESLGEPEKKLPMNISDNETEDERSFGGLRRFSRLVAPLAVSAFTALAWLVSYGVIDLF